MQPQTFYILKNVSLARITRLLDEVGGILSDLQELESQAPAGDLTEVMSLCASFDDLKSGVDSTKESLQPFLEDK
jgi:hypothetical protein